MQYLLQTRWDRNRKEVILKNMSHLERFTIRAGFLCTRRRRESKSGEPEEDLGDPEDRKINLYYSK